MFSLCKFWSARYPTNSDNLERSFNRAANILRLGGRIERLRFRFLELLLELCDAVVLGDLGRILRRFPAQLLRVVVQLLFVFRGVHHAINLVSALAVKSTMGTTRA